MVSAIERFPVEETIVQDYYNALRHFNCLKKHEKDETPNAEGKKEAAIRLLNERATVNKEADVMYQPEFVDIPPEFQIVRTNEVAPGIIPLNTDGRKRECSPVNSERKKIDVAVLDMKMDGIQTLKQIRQKFPLIEVILLTGHGSTETAIQGMKLGAYDYLLKPADFDDLVGKLEGARKRKDEQEERIRAAEARFLLRRSGGAF